MLEHLKLRNVGPAPEMELDLAPRLNVITGDNGLGKSFLLDVAWWALTRTWTGFQALPTSDGGSAEIAFRFEGRTKAKEHHSVFDRSTQSWSLKRGRPAKPGLILYAQADGSFSIWDPARNYWWKRADKEFPYRPPAYHFRSRQIWDGLQDKDNRPWLCNGLINDWVRWQEGGKSEFEQLRAALLALSPSKKERLIPGTPTRISLEDPRDIPTLKMPYGQEVPVLHASAGVRRVMGLAYLLVWAWHEHLRASELVREESARRIIFLVDEVESHLHPRWQRVVLRSLLDVVEALQPSDDFEVQLLAATHSPLVLASLEPIFEQQRDAWFDLDLDLDTVPAQVRLKKRVFIRHGDFSNWLTSPAFDLPSARAKEAEEVLERASQALADEGFDRRRARTLHQELREVLGETDPFWMRWRFVGEKRGWLP